MSEKRLKPGSWLESLNCAIEGILWAARTQKHMRCHLAAAVAVLLASVFFHISALELILVSIAVTFVLFAELFNTALEVVVDLVSPEFHPLARRAKDVAAGSVLVTSVGAVVIGYIVFAPHVFPGISGHLEMLGQPPGELSVISALAVTLLVVLMKALWKRGELLQGGMPSGHAAVAFSIATSIATSGAAPVLSVLAVFMAAMVSQSRLLLKIHSLREVFAGALLGVAVTLIIHHFLG